MCVFSVHLYVCTTVQYTQITVRSMCVFVGQVQADSVSRRGSNASQLGDGPKDGSVLRRVAKVTLDQATKDQKSVRPKHVPEKLDFKNHEKFEGKFSSSFCSRSHRAEEITSQGCYAPGNVREFYSGHGKPGNVRENFS